MIRKDEDLPDVPIMAVTAYSARGDEERIRAAGAQAYVSKPISVVRFAETVDELLERRHDGDRDDGSDEAGAANRGANARTWRIRGGEGARPEPDDRRGYAARLT